MDKDMITQGQHMTADREVMMTIDQGRMDMGTGVMPNGQSIMSSGQSKLPGSGTPNPLIMNSA